MSTTSHAINHALLLEISPSHLTPDEQILSNLLFSKTNPTLAAADLLRHHHHNEPSKPSNTISSFTDICTLLVGLACDFPFLHPRLAALIAAITKTQHTITRSNFLTCMATTLGDLSQSEYAQMFSNGATADANQVAEYINLHSFSAVLLSETCNMTPPLAQEDQIVGFDDTLFMISTALEGHADGHGKPYVDVLVAAQYMVHAGAALWRACQESFGRLEAGKSPLWATRGKLWQGEAGLSRERWVFWRGRFEGSAEGEEDAEGVKDAARMAVRAMDEVVCSSSSA